MMCNSGAGVLQLAALPVLGMAWTFTVHCESVTLREGLTTRPLDSDFQIACALTTYWILLAVDS
jgi:hypothetical protein